MAAFTNITIFLVGMIFAVMSMLGFYKPRQ